MRRSIVSVLRHRPRYLWPILFFMAMRLGWAGDQPWWGQAWSRNMISEERNLPSAFDPNSGRNLKWSAALGTETHSTPVIAGGRVYIGTNNGQPRDPKHQGDRGVLMCFEEATGNLLWQLVVPKREEDRFHDWPNSGISSAATIEGNRVYIVSNRGELICLDTSGMANGNDGPYVDEARHMTPTNLPPIAVGSTDADILWLLNLTTEAGIWSHDAAHSSILIHGPHLYLNSGTGVDNTHKRIRTPNAPSLLVVDKQTGKLLARDGEPIAPRIFHCTWSSPSLAEIQGRPRVFLAAGDGWIYAFEPLSTNNATPPTLSGVTASAGAPALPYLKKVWQFDFDPEAPKEDVHRYNSNRREGPSNIYGMPVVVNQRIYAAGGGDLWWGKKGAWLKCLDAAGQGDVTTSAAQWTYPLEAHVLSTPAVHDGLVFIADCGKNIHCVDAATGQAQWVHQAGGDFWASPLVADGKVYIGSRRGDFWILAASRQMTILGQTKFDHEISGTATAANEVLYVATMSRLYAFKKDPLNSEAGR